MRWRADGEPVLGSGENVFRVGNSGWQRPWWKACGASMVTSSGAGILFPVS